jgi:hypothetical protein
MDIRHPNIAIGSLVGPVAVVREFALVVIELRGKVALGGVAGLDRLSVRVEIIEIIACVRDVRLGAQLTIRGDDPLAGADELGAAFPGRFHRAFKN